MVATITDNKAEKIKEFDPNGHALDNGQLFGLPFNFEESVVSILPVPWEVTVSYNHGTSYSAKAVLEASPQIDLEGRGLTRSWKYSSYL
jgi:agmatinase